MLRASSVNCKRCPLSCRRKSIVDGVGRHDAQLMVVDAYPGRDEDRAGMPQLGEGGRLLRAEVAGICSRLGVDPARVFYTYAARCKPAYGHEVTDAELEACLPWLVGEVEELEPVCILALGTVAQEQMERVMQGCVTFANVKRAYSPTYILKNKSKLPAWSDQIEIAVRHAFGISALPHAAETPDSWNFGTPDMTSRWLSADTEYDTLEEYGSDMVGWSVSDGVVSDFVTTKPPKFNVPVYCHNIRADADHLGIDLDDLDSWEDTQLMAYVTRRFPRVGLKVLGPLLTGIEW